MNRTNYDSRLFAELYDEHPQAIIWMRPIHNEAGTAIIDFEYTYCNDEGLNYLNLAPGQQAALRLSNTPTLTAEMRETVREEMADVLVRGEKQETNFYNPVLNKYARVIRTPLRGGVLTVVQDRTEENRMIRQLEIQTKELEAQKTLLDNILKYSSNGITVGEMVRDDSGKVVDIRTLVANEAAVKFTGFSREEYLSRTAVELDPHFMSSDYAAMCLKTMETGEPFVIQYYLQSIGRWLEISVSKMDEERQIYIFTDITTNKEIQLQVERAAERMQAVFDASQSGMFIFAPEKNEEGEVTDFRFVMTNPALAAYVGKKPEQLQGALGSTYFPGYLHNGVFDMYKETYFTGNTIRRDVHYHEDGLDLYLDLLSTKIHDEVLVTFTDHTAIKKTQFRLEKLVEDLRQSNIKLEEFAHAASHDLKEPIRKVSVFSDRLKSSLANRMDEAERHMFERMQNATQRMTLLVDDLLSYSHVSLIPVETEEVDLNKKLKVVLADLEVPIEEKEAKVTVGTLPAIRGYRRQLQQLFQNLVSNALKYSKPGVPPQIDIRSSLVKGGEVSLKHPLIDTNKAYYLIEVEDNGIGFEQEHAEQIFQMFHRLHGRSEYSGTGIGLAIARKVVENHKGYIWAESAPGKGAKFNILFPVEEKEEQ